MAIVTFSALVAFLIPAVLSFAQEPPAAASAPFRIRTVQQRLVNPPDYSSIVTGSGSRSTSGAQNWLQIETVFDSSPDWADDVRLRYFVLLGRGDNARSLVGEISYINVARGAQHYSGMFVHPNTLQRYGNNGQVEAVAVQLFYKGQMIDQSSYPPSNDRWWERLTPISGLVLPPRETPWSVLTFNRYESPKPTP